MPSDSRQAEYLAVHAAIPFRLRPLAKVIVWAFLREPDPAPVLAEAYAALPVGARAYWAAALTRHRARKARERSRWRHSDAGRTARRVGKRLRDLRGGRAARRRASPASLASQAARTRRYKHSHPDNVAATARRYYLAHREEILARMAAERRARGVPERMAA